MVSWDPTDPVNHYLDHLYLYHHHELHALKVFQLPSLMLIATSNYHIHFKDKETDAPFTLLIAQIKGLPL
jgi:hypothetical protein